MREHSHGRAAAVEGDRRNPRSCYRPVAMQTIHSRPATLGDLEAATDVFITSLDDLVQRKGLLPSTFTRASVLPVYTHIWRTGIFEVAEEDGRIVSICHAIVRDELWFLSGFWTLPAYQ